jgi:hypothetical protein
MLAPKRTLKDRQARAFVEVMQHVASYPSVRVNAEDGKLFFHLPLQTEEELTYLSERGCVRDAKNGFSINVGVNRNSNYQRSKAKNTR